MSVQAETGTIFARATGPGRAGVAIVRVSGPRSGAALMTLAGRVPPPRLATRATLRDLGGAPLDEALTLWFPGPGSFTGEDVAELHVHGSRAVAVGLAEALTGLGCRPAEPGEFARRAFANRKLDLAGAEGLADLIDSETKQQRLMALRQMSGALAGQVEAWRRRLISARALAEAAIDFADEGDVGDRAMEEARLAAIALRADLLAAAGASRAAERVREGFVVALAGRPNAGKSTLLNALARRDAAIVSEIPGTTRDAIEVHLDLGGHAVTLVDTAGLRETRDPIEAEGARRARARIAGADLTLWLHEEAGEVAPSDLPGRVVGLRTKADLGPDAAPGAMAISARTGEGVRELEIWLAGEAAGAAAGGADAVAVRARHRAALEQAAGALARAAGGGDAPELMAEDLRLATRALERLSGRVDVEDVLDEVFGRFCIGK